MNDKRKKYIGLLNSMKIFSLLSNYEKNYLIDALIP